jgi:hypothetical protein
LPVLFLLAVSFLIYVVYRFIRYNYYSFLSQNLLVKASFYVPLFSVEAVLARVKLMIHFAIFKVRSSNYLIFLNLKKLISVGHLFKLSSVIKKNLSKIFDVDPFYANSLYYNSSFIFRRTNPYNLRPSTSQYLNQFLKVKNAFRLTPDQIKAFLKIGLNMRYPVYYFERLFDMEYSRLELEYESPYY